MSFLFQHKWISSGRRHNFNKKVLEVTLIFKFSFQSMVFQFIQVCSQSFCGLWHHSLCLPQCDRPHHLPVQVVIVVHQHQVQKITQKIRSEPDNVWASTYFTPVTCFLLFNCGDYLGRILAGWVRWPGKVSSNNEFFFLKRSTQLQGKGGQNITLLFSLMRTGFVPLFMLCNAAPDRRL